MEYFEGNGNKNYIPSIDGPVTEVIYDPEHCKEQENQGIEEYRILDISKSTDTLSYYDNYADHEESDDNYDDEEDRGVLKHTWAGEDSNEESDKEDEANGELKLAMSNVVKCINFLNKLLEDHQNFITSNIRDLKLIEEQKQSVVINAHMISDLVKANFESNCGKVNEIVSELKKLLAVKLELFDKLYDKQVNGAVSGDVVKRLFSGNNLLIKTQIEELRRILFTKLEAVNRMHTANVQKLKARKIARRKEAKQKVEVFRIKQKPKLKKEDEAKSEAVNILLENKMNTTLHVIQKNKDLLQGHLNRLSEIKKEIPDSEESELLVTDYEEENTESLALEDFDSFTQVVSKKLNLKPEEASPSSILSMFRNNLNKKLQKEGDKRYIQDGTKVCVVEVNPDDFAEEDFIVEEVFFEDVNPEEIDENILKSEIESIVDVKAEEINENILKSESKNYVESQNEHYGSSFIIQDMTHNKPEHSTYNINDITLTKVPSASHSIHRPSGFSYNIKKPLPGEPTNVLHNLDIEKLLLKDRPKALMQLQEMIEKESMQKRQALSTYLKKRLSELESKAQLAKEYLKNLDNHKMKTKKELTKNLSIKSPKKITEGGYIVPYVLDNSTKGTPSYVKVNGSQKLKQQLLANISDDVVIEFEFNVKPLEATALNEKLKALFQNNNLKGNLMKRKLHNASPEMNNCKIRKQEKNVDQNEVNCNRIEFDRDLKGTSITSTNTNTKSIVELDSKTNGIASHPSKRDNNKTSVKKKDIQVVHDVTLARNFNGRRDSKKSILLPGSSSRLAFLKKTQPIKHQWLDKNDVRRNKAKQTALHVEEFRRSDSKSKKLLEKLKQQIFDKLHKQDKARNTAVDVRQEMERRLLKKKVKL